MKRPLIIKALRRSNIRRRIIEYLFEAGSNGSYISEIAHHIRTSPTNVIGAIRGMGKRYKEEDSLLRLKMVEEMEEKDVKLYRLTNFGREIAELLRNNKLL